MFFKVIRSKTFFKNLIKRQKFRNERKDREWECVHSSSIFLSNNMIFPAFQNVMTRPNVFDGQQLMVATDLPTVTKEPPSLWFNVQVSFLPFGFWTSSTYCLNSCSCSYKNSYQPKSYLHCWRLYAELALSQPVLQSWNWYAFSAPGFCSMTCSITNTKSAQQHTCRIQNLDGLVIYPLQRSTF